MILFFWLFESLDALDMLNVHRNNAIILDNVVIFFIDLFFQRSSKMNIIVKLVKLCVIMMVTCTNAYANCTIGEGGVTNYVGNTTEMVAFVDQTAKNFKVALDYLPYNEREFFSDSDNFSQVFDFDNLVAKDIIVSTGSGHMFHVGNFWAAYLPQSTGVVVQCETQCGLSPII